MKNTNTKILTLLFLFTASLTLWGQHVDEASARHRALNFLNRNSRSVTSAPLFLKGSSSSAYLFTDNDRFIIIAAEENLPEVLGYGSCGKGEIPPVVTHFIDAAKFAPQPFETKKKPVAPLVPFVRHQSAPYNNHCPLYKDSHGNITRYHCLVGCVATALEEIISSYRRVVTLRDTLHGWETEKYVIEDVLPGTSVDCRLVRNNYDVDDYTPEEAEAVSWLSYYCGVAAKMKWGINESGANIRNLVEPLQRAFGFPYVKFIDSYQYTPNDWTQIIENEIYAGRPVLYGAFNMWLAGHAFVVDGLDGQGLFHVNWGYEGDYDGYFRLDVLNYSEAPEYETPEGTEAGFFTNHQALLLCPDPVEVTLPDTLERSGKEIAIDSIVCLLQPETNKHSPIAVYVRNTTDQHLRTTFEFFTNAPTDTAIFKQGDYVALTTATLLPYEKKRLLVHAAFDEAGNRLLHVSPDDVEVLYEKSIDVKKGKEALLDFSLPQLTFPKDGEVLITHTVTNADTAGRCGQEIIYEVGPGTADIMEAGRRHSRHLYIQPGESFTDSIAFKNLKPGETYTLLLRSPWKIQTQKTFIMPSASGIEATKSDNAKAIWYLTNGQQICRPSSTGVYLQKTGNTTKKKFIKY